MPWQGCRAPSIGGWQIQRAPDGRAARANREGARAAAILPKSSRRDNRGLLRFRYACRTQENARAIVDSIPEALAVRLSVARAAREHAFRPASARSSNRFGCI